MKIRTRIFCTDKKGFTLIELMVVMLLISIILAVAIPRFDSTPFQDPRKKLSRWMINAVRHLRAEAIQKQKVQALVVDLSEQRLWLMHEEMAEQDLEAAADKVFSLDKSIRMIDAQFPDQESINTGTVEVRFYPSGYSDRVIIHLEDDDAERISFLLEPLLPKVKILDEWIEL